MSGLTAAERRGALLLLLILALGAGHDLWRARRAGRVPRWEGPAVPPPAPLPPRAIAAPTDRADPAAPAERLDLNRASAADLDRLPGIGPVLAGRIVRHRLESGRLRRLEDLLEVPGIGPRLLERLRPLATVHSAQAGGSHLADSGSVPSPSTR